MNGTETLRDVRRTAGVTQRGLAASMGVSVPAVCRWEDGTAWPSIDKLPAMAEALEIGVEELVPVLIRTKGGKTDGEV
jgi:transcriptional regulator with XRE-family HTH domain